jgi:acylphosphatase
MGSTSSKTKCRWHLVLTGAVQHVGLRYTALYLCRGLGLTGWVKNRPDGRVELEVQGAVSDLRRFYVALKSQPHIHVAHADITEVPLRDGERRFSVLRWEND